MSIPLLVHGVLPPGTFQATLGEVTAVFDRSGSRTRSALNMAPGYAATLIWSQDAAAILSVNGSYVTNRVDPIDVDVAIRSDV